MGLDSELVRLLLEVRRRNVNFRDTLTLGRQHYFVGKYPETRALFREFGIDAAAHPDVFVEHPPRYSEAFWRAIGVSDSTRSTPRTSRGPPSYTI